MKAVLIFAREKETKRTWRFVETTGHVPFPVVGTIYVSKDALSTEPPDSIRVSIESQ